MANKLTEIKDYILAKYPQFNAGYANVSKPEGSDLIIDADGQNYAGIDDAHGNHFYIRDLKADNYTPVQRGARVIYYKLTRRIRIVAVYRNGDEDTVLKMLINAISAQRHSVTSANRERTSVFKEETGKDLTRKELTIVSVDFEVNDIVSPKDCSLNPCTC